jgi:hypothetical protein
MPNPVENELTLYLRQLLEDTRAGKIEWSQVNPTTFVWKKELDSGVAQAIIQRVERTERQPPSPMGRVVIKTVRRYVFQVVDKTGAQKVSLDSTIDRIYEPILAEILQVIEQKIAKNGVDYFKRMLESK